MNEELENENASLTDETRGKLKDLSRALIRLHKTLLDAAKVEYEAKNGVIGSPNQYLQLVLNDAHFAWLRKISSLVALIDEAASVRRPASEPNARALFAEAGRLLDFREPDEQFNDEFQIALQTNSDAVINHNDALNCAARI